MCSLIFKEASSHETLRINKQRLITVLLTFESLKVISTLITLFYAIFINVMSQTIPKTFLYRMAHRGPENLILLNEEGDRHSHML